LSISIDAFPKFNSETDDTARIQRAIDYAYINNINEVYIPDGIYMIDGGISILLKNNINVNLAPDAILQVIPNNLDRYYVFYIKNCSGVKIKGGRLIGDRDSHTGSSTAEYGYGIYIDESHYIEITDMYIKDFWDDGICVGEVGEQSSHIAIKNVTCDNNRRQGISLVHCHDVLVEECTLINTNGYGPQCGIDLESSIGVILYNLVVRNCIIYNNTGDGIQSNLGMANCTIENNECYNNNGAGINIMYDMTNGRILGNNCHNNLGNGIDITGYYVEPNSTAKFTLNTKIRDNLSESNGNSGISVVRATSLQILNNVIRNNTNNGIILNDTVINSLIKNNIIGGGTGIGISLQGGSVNNNVVKDNNLTNFTATKTSNTGTNNIIKSHWYN
jgi:hypothetical protein